MMSPSSCCCASARCCWKIVVALLYLMSWPRCGEAAAARKPIRQRPLNCIRGFELKRGQIQGPQLTDGRSSDQASPFKDEEVVPASLLITDLGYFNLRQMAARQQAGGYTLSRLKAGIALFTREGKRLHVNTTLLPPRVGQMKELQVLVGASERLPMRLLLLRVPKEVAEQRREDLRADAQRRGEAVSQEALRLADWTMLLTDVAAKRLRFEEALVLLRERWQ